MRSRASNAEKLILYSRRKRSGCREWAGGLFVSGYGCLWDSNTGKSRRAHVVAYEEAYGPVPEGKIVAHKCDNKRCIEPTHLEAITRKGNTHDAWARGLCEPHQGEAHGMAKLVEQDIRDIRGSGESQAVLAARYGVTRGAIWRIVHRKVWRHVN